MKKEKNGGTKDVEKRLKRVRVGGAKKEGEIENKEVYLWFTHYLYCYGECIKF